MSRVLILGGSGFLGGTLAREALREGHDVWTLTRGRGRVPEGARSLVADRGDDEAFVRAVSGAGVSWDLVVDCIAFQRRDAMQDVRVLDGARAGHLVVVSTESVVEPRDRPWTIDETYDRFASAPYGRGKRDVEEALLAATAGSRAPRDRPGVTVLRPGHIYGPGSLLGCLPMAWRDPSLLDRMKAREALSLVGGGHFLQQPVFAADLWPMAWSCAGNARADGEIYFAPGPDTAPCRDYYRFIAEALGVAFPEVREISVEEHLRARPADALACCHRVCDASKARAHGLALPSTSLRDGLRAHVEALLREA